MSTTTDTTPIEGVVADPPTPPDMGPVPFAELPLREQHEVMAKVTAFQSAMKVYVDNLRKQYGDALFDAHQQLGTKSFIHKFGDDGSVTFTLRDNEDKFSVTSEQAFTEWVEEHFPAEVETIVQVRDAFKTIVLDRLVAEKDDDGEVTVIDPKSGMEVPGVKFVPGGVTRSFQPSWKGNGKQAAINAVMSQSVEEVLPSITTGGAR